VAQGKGPEFKPQYYKKRERERERERENLNCMVRIPIQMVTAGENAHYEEKKNSQLNF
jgi:hypothetical protein